MINRRQLAKWLLWTLSAAAYAQKLHVTAKVPLGGVPYGSIVNQIACSDTGRIWWRQFAGPQVMNGQIVTIGRNGGGSSLASLPDKLPPQGLAYSVTELFAKDGILHIALSTIEGPRLMRYRLSDKQFENVIPFDDRGSVAALTDGKLTVSKLGVLPDGGLVVLGSRALRSDRNTVRFTPVVEMYTQGGQFVKSVDWNNKPSLTSNDEKRSFDSRSIDLAQVAGGADGVYFGVSEGRNIDVLRVSAAGEMEKLFNATLDDGFRATGMQLINSQVLIASTNEAETPQMLRLNVYSASTGDRLAGYEVESRVGALGCSDDGRQITFISTDSIGQRLLISTEP